MLPKANIDLQRLQGIGPKYQIELKKLGIENLIQLAYFFPRKVIDLTTTVAISKAKTLSEQEVVLEARIRSIHVVRTKIKRMWVVEAVLEDDSDAISVIWFNQPYLFKSLKGRKDNLIFKGSLQNNNGKIFLSNPEVHTQKGIVPVYRQTSRMSSKIIGKIIKKILNKSIFSDDVIPDDVLKRYNLPDLFTALKYVHCPKKLSEYKKGKLRFLFEELFLFMLVNLKIKQEFDSQNSPKIKESGEYQKVIRSLPFSLTAGQKSALSDVLEDFSKTHPMNRIIQGDVGSGKTIVAFLAAVEAINSGYQVAFLAPTEILCLQHYENFKRLIDDNNLKKIRLSIQTSKNKTKILQANLIIGTHALFNYRFDNLGLVIIDEQQRFGVEQRGFLLESHDFMPHYLSLSATPIPRSLAHVVFANCDLSIIKEKPKNRQKISTFLVPERKRISSYQFIDKLINQGQQAFVICPLILDGDEYDDKKSVDSEFKMLGKSILGKRRIALLHGRMKADEKEKVISEFRAGKYDILISTSIVEVGVDVPGATVMIIEDAQMFGLSQLHQFRGRIGRSDLKSYCFVFAKIETDTTRNRLKAFVRTDDGFELSSQDLKQRGPGALFDTHQSGFAKINPLWFEDSDLLKNCSEAAREVLGDLQKYPLLHEEVISRISVKHLN